MSTGTHGSGVATAPVLCAYRGTVPDLGSFVGRRGERSFDDHLLRLVSGTNYASIRYCGHTGVSQGIFSGVHSSGSCVPQLSATITFTVSLHLSFSRARRLLRATKLSLSGSGPFSLVVACYVHGNVCSVCRIGRVLFSRNRHYLNILGWGYHLANSLLHYFLSWGEYTLVSGTVCGGEEGAVRGGVARVIFVLSGDNSVSNLRSSAVNNFGSVLHGRGHLTNSTCISAILFSGSDRIVRSHIGVGEMGPVASGRCFINKYATLLSTVKCTVHRVNGVRGCTHGRSIPEGALFVVAASKCRGTDHGFSCGAVGSLVRGRGGGCN